MSVRKPNNRIIRPVEHGQFYASRPTRAASRNLKLEEIIPPVQKGPPFICNHLDVCASVKEHRRKAKPVGFKGPAWTCNHQDQCQSLEEHRSTNKAKKESSWECNHEPRCSSLDTHRRVRMQIKKQSKLG